MFSCSVGVVISNGLCCTNPNADPNANANTDSNANADPNPNANCGGGIHLEMV